MHQVIGDKPKIGLWPLKRAALYMTTETIEYVSQRAKQKRGGLPPGSTAAWFYIKI